MTTQSLKPSGLAKLRDIQWDSTSYSMAIGEQEVLLTQMEYHIVFLLRYGVPVSYSKIALVVYGSKVNERILIALDKHVDRIRRKMKHTGYRVFCLKGYGYMLWHVEETIH